MLCPLCRKVSGWWQVTKIYPRQISHSVVLFLNSLNKHSCWPAYSNRSEFNTGNQYILNFAYSAPCPAYLQLGLRLLIWHLICPLVLPLAVIPFCTFLTTGVPIWKVWAKYRWYKPIKLIEVVFVLVCLTGRAGGQFTHFMIHTHFSFSTYRLPLPPILHSLCHHSLSPYPSLAHFSRNSETTGVVCRVSFGHKEYLWREFTFCRLY